MVVYHLIALIEGLERLSQLSGARFMPLLLSFNLIWIVLFGGLTVMSLRRSVSASRYATRLWTAFLLFSVLRLALFVQADYDRGRLPFLLTGTSVFLVAFALTKLRSSHRSA